MSRKQITASRPSHMVGFSRISSQQYITEYLLKKNGLRVLYAHVKGSPTITTNIVYHVGSQHEDRGQTGLAHMLEHMLFKPTATNGVTWKDLEDEGAALNATTWLDRTMYYFTLPKEYFGKMLQVEADRMRNIRLENSEFLPERSNVLSEYETYYSQPEMVLEWSIVSSAFQSHGYKHDTIGFKEDIATFTIEKLRDFYDTYYWPDNATLIVVGDLTEEELLTSVRKVFSKITIPKERKTKTQPPVEPEQTGIKHVTLERETPVRVITIAFRAPSFKNRAWTNLYVGLNKLAIGKDSDLYGRLVESHLATSVDAHLYPTLDPFLATISISASEHTTYDVIEKEVFNAIDELNKNQIPTKKLDILKQFIYAQEMFTRDGTYSIAANLAECVACGDWKHFFNAPKEIHRATGASVLDATRTYLKRSHAVIGTIEKPSKI